MPVFMYTDTSCEHKCLNSLNTHASRPMKTYKHLHVYKHNTLINIYTLYTLIHLGPYFGSFYHPFFTFMIHLMKTINSTKIN